MCENDFDVLRVAGMMPESVAKIYVLGLQISHRRRTDGERQGKRRLILHIAW